MEDNGPIEVVNLEETAYVKRVALDAIVSKGSVCATDATANHIWCSVAIWEVRMSADIHADAKEQHERVFRRIVGLSLPLRVSHRVLRVNGLCGRRRRAREWPGRFSWSSQLSMCVTSAAVPRGYLTDYYVRDMTKANIRAADWKGSLRGGSSTERRGQRTRLRSRPRRPLSSCCTLRDARRRPSAVN